MNINPTTDIEIETVTGGLDTPIEASGYSPVEGVFGDRFKVGPRQDALTADLAAEGIDVSDPVVVEHALAGYAC